MTDTPTDKKLSERFAEARDAKVFSGALLDEVQAAIRLSESHPSAIREAEREREACAKIADANADAAAEREYPDLENQAIAIAAAIRARGEEKGQ